MIFSDLSDELKEILTAVFDIDESTQNIPVFDRDSVEKIFWKLTSFDEESAKALAEELSSFVSSLKRPEDQVLVSAVIQRPAARVTEDDIALISELDKMEKIFHSVLEKDERSPKIDMGLLLFSAVRYGGLLDEHNVLQLFHKLRRGEPPTVIGKTAWYIFKHDVGGKVLWLPEPLTLGLITQWCKQDKAKAMKQQAAKRHGWHYYLNQVTRVDNAKKLIWKPKRFLKACRVRLSMDIAPALVDVASGTTPTCTFLEQTWLRLLTQKAPSLAIEHKRKATQSVTFDMDQFEDLASSFETEALERIKKVANRLKDRPVQQILEAINEEYRVFATRLSANFNLLIEWMLFRLVNAGSWSGPLKLSSALNRLDLLCGAFRAQKYVNDVLLLDTEDTTELYESIIARYQSKQKVTIVRALRDFHDFLIRNYGVDPNYTPDKYILREGKKNKALTVDAEVLLPWEYVQLKEYLTRVAKSPDYGSVARLVLAALILSYRVGFRRSEVHYLRVNDFSIWDEKPEFTEIIVKEHSLRTLKSPSAYRRIKIGALLTPPEERIILALVNERKAQDGSNAFVFRTLECDRPYISGKRLFDPLAQLLKQVTGNPAMRFHHLRHSVATWNFWRWMAPSSGKHSGIPTLAKLVRFEQVATERRAILGVRDGLEPSRKTLHALSMMIGHSHPTTTLRHYVHSTHITLHDQLCVVQPRLKKKVLAELAGLTPRGLLKARQRHDTEDGTPALDEWSATSVRDKCLATLVSLQDKDMPTKGWRKKTSLNLTWQNREPSGERSEVIDYYQAAKEYFDGTDSITWLENRYAIFGTTLIKVLEQAGTLFELQMEVRKGNGAIQRPRHWERLSVERLDHSTGEIYKEPDYQKRLPSLPRQIRERITIEKMIVAAQSLNKTQQAKLIKALDYFVHNSNRHDSGVSFTKRRSLDAFVAAMRLLNLKRVDEEGNSFEGLRITISAPNAVQQRSALFFYWNKRVGFNGYQAAFRERRLSSKYKHGLAHLDLMAVKVDSKRKNRRVADSGFRVGLYVLYVTRAVWGIR